MIDSATTLPTIGPCWNPCPLNPAAIQSPSTGAGPTTGGRSGVISYNPAHREWIPASASGG